MNTVTIRKIDIQLPANWNEISKRNLLFLAKRFPYSNKIGFPIAFYMHALDLWKNHKLAFALARNFILSRKMDKAWKDDAVIEFGETSFFEQQIIQSLNELDNFAWLSEIGIIENCLIDKFRIGFTTYYGPSKLLANMTVEEMSNADDFLISFLDEKEEKYLDYLIAVLWREKSSHPTPEDIRVQFSEFAVEKRRKKIAKLSQHLKNACLINYLGMRNYFISRENSKIVFSSSSKGSGSQTNWGTIIMRLAENQTFGTFAEVKKTFAHDIIDHLADLKKRAK